MAGEYQDKGWQVVDYEDSDDRDLFIATLAMQQGVGVFVRVTSGATEGEWRIGDPFFVRDAMLETAEPTEEGKPRVRIIGETPTLLDKARRFDVDQRGIEKREKIGERLDAALAKADRLDKDRSRLLTELASYREADAAKVRGKRIP